MQSEIRGWQPIPPADEATVRDAWVSHLQPGESIVLPKPSRTWRGEALARHREHPDLEADFTTKLLNAFRRCVLPGERLCVIDWQHAWYYLDPPPPR